MWASGRSLQGPVYYIPFPELSDRPWEAWHTIALCHLGNDIQDIGKKKKNVLFELELWTDSVNSDDVAEGAGGDGGHVRDFQTPE